MQVTWQATNNVGNIVPFDIHQKWGPGWVTEGFVFYMWVPEHRAFTCNVGMWPSVAEGKEEIQNRLWAGEELISIHAPSKPEEAP